MAARFLFQRLSLLLTAAALLAATTVGVTAPVVKSKGHPADEPATLAIDPAKLADSAPLRAAAARNLAASHKNLQKIAVALHDADENKGSLPTDILSKDGKPLLSWRVKILPYIEEGPFKLEPPTKDAAGARKTGKAFAFFKQFKLDQPWDSKHNLALLEKMPDVFASPRVIVKRKGYTVYQVFSGPGALFDAGKTKYKLGNIPDGTSNTIFAVETSKAVPWTKPADHPFDKDKDVADFGTAYSGKPLAVMMDGSARVLDLKKLSATTLKNAIMPDDGNVLGADWE